MTTTRSPIQFLANSLSDKEEVIMKAFGILVMFVVFFGGLGSASAQEAKSPFKEIHRLLQ